jgi:hypothetical protein
MNSRRWSHALLLVLGACLVLGAPSAQAADAAAAPLSVRIGGAEFTPGGTVDMTGIFRASNTGSMVATAFGTIPYENTVGGHNSEWRMSAQMSRVSLKITDSFNGTSVLGYVEGDFAGNSAANLYVNVNSSTFRMKYYFADVQHGRWELLAGQAWGWATPSRKGLGPEPGNAFVTKNLDVSLQVGLPWTRAAQVRAAYHASEHLAMGVALENPEQYVGAGEVIFPFAFNAALGSQFDAANQTSTPNYLPDMLGKVVWDGGGAEHLVHLEAVGVARRFRATYVPLGGSTFDHTEATGLGAGVSGNLVLHKKLRLVASGFRGDGIGRYLGGQGPDVVVRPNDAATSISLSTVHGQSFLFGIEADLPAANSVSAYYGRLDFDRNAFLDTTSPLATKPVIGFGGINSPSSANRTLHEATVNASHTFWSSPDHGALALMGQFSEVFRQPWFASAGSPNRALVDMAFLNVRYTLP